MGLDQEDDPVKPEIVTTVAQIGATETPARRELIDLFVIYA